VKNVVGRADPAVDSCMRTLIACALVPFAAASALAEGDAAPPAKNPRRTPVVEAVEKAAPAVVSVGTTKIVRVRYFDWDFLQKTAQQEQKGLGSGVIVHPSGYVVTNAHVINQADQILVKLTGAREKEPEIPAVVIAADREHDLALLRLEKPGPYPFVEFGRSDDLMLGETVIAIGNPFGLGRTVTTGIISALDRSIDVRDARFSGLIQTDAAVNRGNSGGPLVNVNGDWVGINSAIYSLSGGADGISFAIPVDTVRRTFLDGAFRARFAGVWLGLTFALRPDGKIVVGRVFEGGPAEKAGLAAGDVIASAGDPLRFAFDMVEASRKGELRVTVAGDGAKGREVTLPFERPPVEDLAWKRLGVRCAVLDDALAERLPYFVGSAGLVVTDVKDGGPAGRIGLERGDLLMSLGASRLQTTDDLLTAVLEGEKGQAAELRLRRATRTAFGVKLDDWKARILFE
jgi:serine protease Do